MRWNRSGMCLAALLSACSSSEKSENDAAATADEDGGRGASIDGSTQPALDGRVRPPRDADPRGGDGACMHAELSFDPRPPTTFLLVDRSGSMFDIITNGSNRWDPLKQGILSVVQQLSKDVRWGFASYTGKAMGICPDMTDVPIADDNYSAIAAAYNALGAPPYKGETPTAAALTQVADMLAASDEDARSIVLVTDGEPDFCDDGRELCARDAVVGAAQAAYAKNIRTFIFGIGEVSTAHLRDVANAGIGQPVSDHSNAVANTCAAGTIRGSYSATDGNAPYFQPDLANQAALAEVLAGVVASTRPCVLDLTGRVRVDLDQADTGTVYIDGQPIPYGGANGFRLNSPTELELLGTSCQAIRTTRAVKINVDYPCEAVIYI